MINTHYKKFILNPEDMHSIGWIVLYSHLLILIVDLSKAKRVLQEQKRVNVDFPTWMIDSLDREAGKLGVTRQSIIKVWLAERHEMVSSKDRKSVV